MLPYVLLAKIAVVIALLGASAYGVHKYNEHFRESGRAEVRAEYAALLEKAHEESRNAELRYNQKIKEANDAANRRNKQIDAAHAAAQSANDGLRSAVDSLSNSVSGATAAALTNAVTSTSSLLVTCSERYSGVAEKGSRHASDVETLIGHWPDYAKIGEKK